MPSRLGNAALRPVAVLPRRTGPARAAKWSTLTMSLSRGPTGTRTGPAGRHTYRHDGASYVRGSLEPGRRWRAGGGPQDSAAPDQRGVSVGRRHGVDPAAVADQMTQLDGAPIPAQAAGPVPPQPPAAPSGPPADVSYQPTAPAFPTQAPGTPGAAPGYGAPGPLGAPIGPYDPPQAAPSYGYPQPMPTPPPAYNAAQGGYGHPARCPTRAATACRRSTASSRSATTTQARPRPSSATGCWSSAPSPAASWRSAS